jgi:hypothetical protein
MKSTLFEILRRQKGLEAVRTGRLPAGVALPLKLESDVKSMETKLLSPQFYAELVRTNMLTGSYTSVERLFEFRYCT